MYEKPKATDESSSSKTSPNWHYPKTKREALDMKDIGAKISITENLAGSIVNFLQSLGADNEIPSGKKNRVAWLNHFHSQLAVNNPLWPEDMPFGFVYGAFVNAVMYNRVELKGHNIHAFISAFKRWFIQPGVEDNLRRSYYEAYPEAAPKQIEDKKSSEPDEETKKLQAEGYVNFSPDVVERQVGILKMMYGGSFEKALADVEGMKSYRRRLHNTYEKYKEEGKI